MSIQIIGSEAKKIAEWLEIPKARAKGWHIPNGGEQSLAELGEWLYSLQGQDQVMDELIHDDWMVTIWKPILHNGSGYKVDLAKETKRVQAKGITRQHALLEVVLKMLSLDENLSV